MSHAPADIVDTWTTALLPPEDLTVRQWADQRRWVSRRAGTSKAGWWETAAAPHTAGPMEAATDPNVEIIAMCWGAQTSKTETGLNVLGYWIDVDPGVTIVATPIEPVEAKYKQRLRILIEDTPALKRHMTAKALRGPIFELDRMRIEFVNMASPAQARSTPAKNLIVEEVDDDGEKGATVEGDPFELLRKRTNTYSDRKIVIPFTPTTPDKRGWQLWLQSDQRKFMVPCLSCGARQEWDFRQLKWDERPQDRTPENHAAHVKNGTVQVWYECAACGHRHFEKDKPLMNTRGEWRATKPEAIEAGRWHIAGFHVPSLVSQFYRWTDLVHDWLVSYRDKEKLRVFRNTVEAMPWEDEERTAQETDDVLRRIRRDIPRGAVPSDCSVLTAATDVQGDRVLYMVMAWGDNRRCHVVDHGVAMDLEDMREAVFGRSYKRQGDGAELSVRGCLVDSGFNTEDVVEWCFAQQCAGVPIGPCRGNPHSGPGTGQKALVSYRERDVRPRYDQKGGRITVFDIEVNKAKDRLVAIMQRTPGQHNSMSYHAETDTTLAEQMTSEERAVVTDAKGFNRYVWRKKSAGRENHWWDTAVYNLALVETLPDESEEMPPPREPEPQPEPEPEHFGYDSQPYLVTERHY